MKAPVLPLLPGFIRRKVEESQALQKTINNVGWLFFDKLFRMGIGLLVMSWVARYLGPEQYGVWSYSIAFAALFGPLATLGLDGIVVRELVRDSSRKEEILGSAFVLKLGGGIVALAFSCGLIILLKPHDTLTIALVLISGLAFLFQSSDIVDLYFQSQVESKYTILARDSAFVLLSLTRVILILTGASLIVFAAAGLAEAIVAGTLLFVAYQLRGENALLWKARLHAMQSLLRDSWPLIFSGLVIMVYMRIDQVMLGEMVGNTAVGVYAAAVRISEIWYFIPVAVSGSLYPAIIELRELNPDLYRRRLQQLFDSLMWVSFGGALVVSLFSRVIVRLLYGEQFGESAGILIVHVWTGVFVSLGVASGKYLLAENLTRISFYRSLSGAVVNVLANFILIPLYGAIGAAIATLVSQALATYLFDAFNPQTKPLFRMKTRALFFMNTFGMSRGNV